jgi:hypothetical protein
MLHPNGGAPYEDDERIHQRSRGHRASSSTQTLHSQDVGAMARLASSLSSYEDAIRYAPNTHRASE